VVNNYLQPSNMDWEHVISRSLHKQDSEHVNAWNHGGSEKASGPSSECVNTGMRVHVKLLIDSAKGNIMHHVTLPDPKGFLEGQVAGAVYHDLFP